ncbi:hypothetical protein [Chitinophaga sp. LS1]|uniref:AbiU2 domain-containing protein n=1 Tax=Chitinophaga sp. LS1 TaxID=3051176 RepID=UPI002AABE683|nr:hypothetical protein [Chitinophaga sp. LS1]WPV70557.1 hypothetical protein QQL36_17755 [Chitinophaga sp. LS1]
MESNKKFYNEDKYKELHDWIREFWKITYECKLCYLYCIRLYGAKNQDEADYLNSSKFFKNTAHIYWRNLVIEVAKLFIPRDAHHYNIQNLIKYFENKPEYKQVGLSSVVLKQWADFLEEKKETINVVWGLRDRFYSHTDKPNKKEEVDYSNILIDDLKPLIDMAEGVIKEVYHVAFDSDTDFFVDYKDRDFDFLTVLSNDRLNKINYWKQKLEGQ